MSDLLKIIDFFLQSVEGLILTFLCLRKNVSPGSHICTHPGDKTNKQKHSLYLIMYSGQLCLKPLQLQQLLTTFTTKLSWISFVYFLWNHSYINSSEKQSFKCEVSLLASMLTCMKSNLLNSRFIILKVHEGKSLKV